MVKCKKVCIMRGPSGAGKSTLARAIKADAERAGQTAVIVSADDYFCKSGSYAFDAKKLHDAHKECFENFLDGMMTNDIVIVDNTNIRLWEFSSYVKVAKIADVAIDVHELKPSSEKEIRALYERCVHGVPYEKIKQMYARWEEFST